MGSSCRGHCYLYDMEGNEAAWYSAPCGDSSHHGNSFCYAIEGASLPAGWNDRTIIVDGHERYYAQYVCPGCAGQTLPLVMLGPGTSATRWDTPWEEIQFYAEEGSYAVV